MEITLEMKERLRAWMKEVGTSEAVINERLKTDDFIIDLLNTEEFKGEDYHIKFINQGIRCIKSYIQGETKVDETNR